MAPTCTMPTGFVDVEPIEVFVAPLLAVSTADLVRVSLSCRGLHQMFFGKAGDSASGSAFDTLVAYARSAGMRACHAASFASSKGGGDLVYVQSLGLPLKVCSEYCDAARHFTPLQPLHFGAACEVMALLAANQRMHALSLSRILSPESSPASMASFFPRRAGGSELCVVATFTLEPNISGIPACSQWCWIEVPPHSSQPSGGGSLGKCRSAAGGVEHHARKKRAGAVTVSSPLPQPPLRVGLQLEAQLPHFVDGRQLRQLDRPELRCVVSAPTEARVCVQAVSCMPALGFELGLVAGGFDAYGNEEDGWYYPREECNWRALQPEEQNTSDDNEWSSDDENPGGSASGLVSLRVLLRVRTAVRGSDRSCPRRCLTPFGQRLMR